MERLKFYIHRAINDLREANLADWFSIFRIIAAPFIILLVFLDMRQAVAWLVLICFLTDLIDGQLARHLDMKTERGANLDSRGDAMTFIAAATAIIYFEWDYFKSYWWLWGAGLFLYLLQLVIALIKYGKPTSFHTRSAKVAAFVQGVFLIVSLFFRPYDFLFFTAVAISILETLEELSLIFIFRSWKSDVKGLYWVLKKKNPDKSDQ